MASSFQTYAVICNPTRTRQSSTSASRVMVRSGTSASNLDQFLVSPICGPADIYDMRTISNMPGQRQEKGNTTAPEPTCNRSLSCELSHETPILDTIPATDIDFG